MAIITNPITTLEYADTLISQYQAFLVDLWGVVHNGDDAYPDTVDCLNHMIDAGKNIIFLSNAPRPGHIALQKLLELGIQANLDMMLTSGDAVRYQFSHFLDPLFTIYGRRFYHLGAHVNQDIVSGLQVDETDTLEEANFILLTLFMEEGEDMHRYDPLFKKAIDLKIPILCANPDRHVQLKGRMRHCAGFLAERFEAMGGIVFYYGKPHSAIYDMAFERLQPLGVKDKSNILMIGDTIDTDVLGAEKFGIDSALVLNGNTLAALRSFSAQTTQTSTSKESQSQGLAQLFERHRLTPTWVLERFALS